MSRIQGDWYRTETNGASVVSLVEAHGWRMSLPRGCHRYANAQIDDYSGRRDALFQWRPQTAFRAQARFSAEVGRLVGTAGFGFWNAPFGPGAGFGLRLPQATWFFYASDASNLPLAPGDGRGNGWFAATIDAATPRAMSWAPLLLPVLLLNQVKAVRRVLWPMVQRDLGISFQRLQIAMGSWHTYQILWHVGRTVFKVDGQPVLIAPSSPRGPLGFVSWIDNQRMEATSTGRLRWGTEQTAEEQWLEIAEIALDRAC